MTNSFLRNFLIVAISILFIGFVTYVVYQVFTPSPEVPKKGSEERTITPVTPETTDLPIPNAPILSSFTGERPFIQMIWNREIADYFNIYRATNPEGPWEKISDNFPQSAHTAVDYDYPKDVELLYYRITSVDKVGNESEPSMISSIRIRNN